MNNYMDEMGDKSYLSSEIMWKTLNNNKKLLKSFIFYFISWLPSYDINCLLGIFGDQWIVFFLLCNQFLKLWEALLELLFGWRVLTDGTDQLHGVQSGLIALVIEEGDDFV